MTRSSRSAPIRPTRTLTAIAWATGADCEEAVLRTDPSLVDTDKDGLPDHLEWNRGSDPLVDDLLLDSDHDGIPSRSGLGTCQLVRTIPLRLFSTQWHSFTVEGGRSCEA